MPLDEDWINSRRLDRLKAEDKDLSTLGISEAVIKEHFGHVT